jgi:uncharacterized protein YcfL
MKKYFISLAVVLSSLFILAACSSNEYQNAMDKGIKSLGEKDYHQASVYFELALNKKEGDKEASAYFDQANQMEQAIQAYKQQKLNSALNSLNTIIEYKNGLKSLQTEAKNLKEKIVLEKEQTASFEEKVETVKSQISNEDYHSAQEELQILQGEIKESEMLSNYQPEITKLTEKVDLALMKLQEQEKEAKAAENITTEKEQIIEEKITYQTYTNDRFGFSLQYPSGLTMAPPPTNGDGAHFYNNEIDIKAYGGHTNIVQQGETIETYYQQDINSIPGEIAYQKVTEDWYVLSYKENGNIIYKKFFFGDSVFNAFIIAYPASTQDKYGPVTTHISKTFASSVE